MPLRDLSSLVLKTSRPSLSVPLNTSGLANWSALHYKYDLFTMYCFVTPTICPGSWDCMRSKWDNTFISVAFFMHLKWACASEQLCGSGSIWGWVFPVPDVMDELVIMQNSHPGDHQFPLEMGSPAIISIAKWKTQEWVRQCYFACRNHTFSSLFSQNQFQAVQRCQSSVWRNAVPWRVCYCKPRASTSPHPKDLSSLCHHLGTKREPPPAAEGACLAARQKLGSQPPTAIEGLQEVIDVEIQGSECPQRVM